MEVNINTPDLDEIQAMTTEDATLSEKIEAFVVLKQQIAELTQQLDQQKAELRTYLTDGADTRVVGKHSITVKHCTRNAIDTKALQAAHPRLADKFMKTTSYDTVTIK